MSFELAVQAMVYAMLTGSTEVMAAVDAVYDEVPEQEPDGSPVDYPYIVIGEDLHAEMDTVGILGDDCSITIHTWSRHRGRKETKAIQGKIYDAMHRANPTYTGYNVLGVDCVNSQSFLDQDGLTRHGVQTFRIMLNKG